MLMRCGNSKHCSATFKNRYKKRLFGKNREEFSEKHHHLFRLPLHTFFRSQRHDEY